MDVLHQGSRLRTASRRHLHFLLRFLCQPHRSQLPTRLCLLSHFQIRHPIRWRHFRLQIRLQLSEHGFPLYCISSSLILRQQIDMRKKSFHLVRSQNALR